ncbi:MAG: hypothetical protein LBS46_09460 [Dysgonamonadaceae bacterium]|jgi:predicted lysophospholipase L1 biosynthesis ABC-type transport system permease subunit|nr:hypothetical protein [Dysgonamonadaceae bacterium]
MNKQTEDIKAIREMMERSSKFQSLSGLSLVFAGLLACAGAAFAYCYLLRDPSSTNFNRNQEILILLADALLVLLLSVSVITFFCYRKARQNHQSLFSSVTKRAAYNLLIPLATGGIFSLLFLFRNEIEMVAASTLIFYGLALINASKFTYSEIHYLGIAEIITGLLAAFVLHQGIWWWTSGFGLLHVIFGFLIYIKYDKTKK